MICIYCIEKKKNNRKLKKIIKNKKWNDVSVQRQYHQSCVQTCKNPIGYTNQISHKPFQIFHYGKSFTCLHIQKALAQIRLQKDRKVHLWSICQHMVLHTLGRMVGVDTIYSFHCYGETHL